MLFMILKESWNHPFQNYF